MFELSLNRVKKYMDATLVLKNISFQVYAGEKVGIVGANGSGKTTILKLIAGIEPLHCFPGYPQTTSHGYDEGIISVPKEASIAYLEQIPQYDDQMKVIDVLNLAFDKVHRIEYDMRQLEEKMKDVATHDLDLTLKKYSDLIQLFESKGGYETEEKLSKICTGLKFDENFKNKPFHLLSGGEKTTVILGKILMDQPDILLLDEPTNHLDMDSIEWLEGYIKGYKGIVIIVSHDRYFLDNTVNKIVEIEDMECETYKGNYTDFVNQKEENMRIQYEHFREQQKKISAIEKTIKDLRDWAMRADNNKFFRRAVSMQIKLDKLDRIEKPKFERQNMKLDFKDYDRSGNDTIKAIDLSKRYEDQILFEHADMLIKYGERVALIGPNGSGKTTFLKMLLGGETPDSGQVELGANVKTAYLPQTVTFENDELTVVECFREDFFILEGKAREYLSKFMFYGKSAYKKVKHLSGGERIRLKLAKLLYEDVNLLILDEPTNHLDIESIETFEVALEEFNGTIFFISHDRYFINKMCERIIAIEDHTFKTYDGNFEFYKNVKTQEINKRINEQSIIVEKNNKTQYNEVNKNPELEKSKLEKKIESIEQEIQAVDSKMNHTELDYEELNKLYGIKLDLSEQLDHMIEKWLSIEKE